jgi:hypothetical protein
MQNLNDPQLLHVVPSPSPDIFRHVSQNRQDLVHLAKVVNPPGMWGSSHHPYDAPPGTTKLLSSDYDYLSRVAATDPNDNELVPEPPVVMQKTR